MKPTKHARTNFRRLSPFLEAVNAAPGKHRRFTAPGFMDLCIESLECTDYRGFPVYAIAHYGRQNGDAMADPDMEISVDFSACEIHPLTYQNDYMGIYQQVYMTNEAGQHLYSPRLRTQLDEFLFQWLRNIENQGFSPSVFSA